MLEDLDYDAQEELSWQREEGGECIEKLVFVSKQS